MPDEIVTAKQCCASCRNGLRWWGKKKSSHGELKAPAPPAEKKSEKVEEKPKPSEEITPGDTQKSKAEPVEQKPAPATPKISPIVAATSSQPKETPSIFRKKSAEKEAKVEKAPEAPKETNAFDEAALQQVWLAYKKESEEKGVSDTEMLVLNRTVTKTGEHDVLIQLASSLEISILERQEQGIVQYFRKHLKNSLIQLQKAVSEQEKSKKLYTSKEKYDYMVEQNPALKDLKERLGLDFEF